MGPTSNPQPKEQAEDEGMPAEMMKDFDEIREAQGQIQKEQDEEEDAIKDTAQEDKDDDDTKEEPPKTKVEKKEEPRKQPSVESGLLRCSVCGNDFPESDFSKTQLRKGPKRKSRVCIEK